MTSATMPRRNEPGRKIIRAATGLRLESYLCPARIPTSGYGHTGGVKMGDTITKEQAVSLPSMNLADVEQCVGPGQAWAQSARVLAIRPCGEQVEIAAVAEDSRLHVI